MEKITSFLQLGHSKPSSASSATQAASNGKTSSAQVEKAEQDEGWTDCSSEDAMTPEKKDTEVRKMSGTAPAFNPIKPEEEKELMKYMPALLHKELPPCNADIQVAYLRVVGQLRERWLAERGHISLVRLCRDLKNELDVQAARFPPESLRMKKVRKPWRREGVFKFEVRWANYFLREAKLVELAHTAEAGHERAMNGPVPPELGFDVSSHPAVLTLWYKWNELRQVQKPKLPEPEEDLVDVKKEVDGHAENGIDENKVKTEVSEETTATAVQDKTPAPVDVAPPSKQPDIKPFDTIPANKNVEEGNDQWSHHGHD